MDADNPYLAGPRVSSGDNPYLAGPRVTSEDNPYLAGPRLPSRPVPQPALSNAQGSSPESLLSAAEPTPPAGPQSDLSKVGGMIASDPMGTLKKLGFATLEEGKHLGEGVLNAVKLPGDVATGKTNMQQPEAQNRVMDLASLFGFKGAPGGKAGIAAPAVKEGEQVVVGGPNHAGVREGAGLGPNTGQPGFETTGGQFVNRTEGTQIAKQTGQAQPGTGAALHSENLQNTPTAEPLKLPGAAPPQAVGEKLGTPNAAPPIPGQTRDGPVPQAAGAAGTPTADILAQNIRDREAEIAKLPGAKNIFQNAGHMARKLLAPQTLDASGGRAAAAVRQEIGRGTRDSERIKATLEGYQKQVNAYDPQPKLDIIDWIQSHTAKTRSGYAPASEVAPLLGSIRDAFTSRRMKMENAPSTEKMRFVEDYFPQMWKDPNAAREFAKNFGTREGNKGFTKERKIPTVADGIRAGLVPVELDPIGATLRYVENVDRYLATNEVFDIGVNQGDVLYRTPGEQPPGWVEVKTARQSNQGTPYAPEGWATVYNNFVSKAADVNKPGGYILDRAQALSNSITAFKLGLSGYHALNMVGETMVGGLSNAIDEAVAGHPIRAVVAAGKTPFKPVTSALRGAQMQRAYLKGAGSPQMMKVVDLATDANFRVAGKGRIADEYRFTGQGSLWNAYRKGALRTEMGGLMRGIGEAPITGTAKALGSIMARTLETITDPLFKLYIPAIKNGQYYDMLSTWLNAHPTASVEDQVAFARKAADIIGDRFGEMNQDNIFWERWHKQVAQTLLTSYSYQMGSVRSFAGAALDTAMAIPRKARGGEAWTPKMSYALALPIVIGTLGGIYMYWKTGKPPRSPRDLAYPQTGGVDATSGEPERAVLPSYVSQLLNAYNDPWQEAGNKANGSFDLAHAFLTGKDWRGDPIAPITDDKSQAIAAYLGEVAKAYEPISVANRAKVGSNIGGAERFMGVKSAPLFATDPEGYAQIMRNKEVRAAQQKMRHDALDKARYGGTHQ